MVPVFKEEKENFIAWMDGWMSMAEPSDSQMQAVGEDAVRAFNAEHKTKYDPYEGWMLWARSHSSSSSN